MPSSRGSSQTRVEPRSPALQQILLLCEPPVQSVQFSCSVVSDSLQPHKLQHTRLPGPSLTPELTQTHVHQVDDAIQTSHPLLPPSSPTFNLSWHQGHCPSVMLCQWSNFFNCVWKIMTPNNLCWKINCASQSWPKTVDQLFKQNLKKLIVSKSGTQYN